MFEIIPELSFVATIKCLVEDHEGYLDFNTAEDRGAEAENSLTPTLRLTVNNYYDSPDIEASRPCDFHFRAIQYEGETIYNIVAKFGNKMLQMLSQEEDGAILLRPFVHPTRFEFWRLRSAPEQIEPKEPGEYAGIWLERVIDEDEDPLPAGTGFYVQTKRNSGRYWNALLTCQMGDERIPFLGDLYVSRIGFYNPVRLELDTREDMSWPSVLMDLDR